MPFPSRQRSVLLLWLALLSAWPAVAADPPGQLDLGGRWRVFAGDEPAAASPRLDDSGWREVTLPASWHDLGYGDLDGLLWLRRQLVLPESWQGDLAPSGLAVMIDGAASGAYELFVGGRSVGVHGEPGQGLPIPEPRVFRVPTELVEPGGRLQLALAFHRVAWPIDRLARGGGPVGREVRAGDFETLHAAAELERLHDRHRRLPAVILAGFLAAISLYHLLLYARRRQAAEYLWFALLACDAAALIFVAYGGPQLLGSEGVRRRLVALFSHLGVALLIQFLWPLLSRPIGKVMRGYQLSHCALGVLAAVVPAIGWVAVSQLWRWLWMLPGLLVAGALAARAAWRPGERRLVFAAVAVLPFALLVAPFFQGAGVLPALPLPALALTFLGVAMSAAISDHFTRAHRELDQFRHELEQMVEEQTDELSATHKRLQSEVAERKLVEGAMRMLERAVEQSIDGIAVTDLAGSCHFLNEAWARMHGHEAFEVLGYEISLFHTSEQMQHQVYPMLAQVRRKGAFQGEVWHRRKDGTVFPTWMSVTLLVEEGDGPVGMLAIMRDVTERRKASEEQLRLETKVQQAEKLESLAILASGIAHDYNNLLTGVLGNTSLLLRDLPAEASARGKIRQIEAAAERAATLSDQLLAYAGEDQLSLQTVAINDLIGGLRDELARLAPESVHLEFQLNDALPLIDVDPAQIAQVIRNLFVNACESIGAERGVVTLRTSAVEADRRYFEGAFFDEGQPPGRYVFFEVSDSGYGIAEGEMRTRIFDPFFSTKGSGRGLGLATALGVVRGHRGAIKIYSQVGRGSTFEVLFPASVALAVTAPAEDEQLERWRGSGTVLVVDDEPLVREVSRDILEQHGFEVLTAEDGREAVAIFERRRGGVRLVLLDLTMPVMDGEQAFREIRRLDPAATVVLMSGYSKKRAGERLAEEGLAGFLHKPFRPDDLARKVREVLGK